MPYDINDSLEKPITGQRSEKGKADPPRHLSILLLDVDQWVLVDNVEQLFFLSDIGPLRSILDIIGEVVS